jgi:PKD repeat protein
MQWNMSLMSSADRMAGPTVALVKVEYTVNSKPGVTVGPPLQAPKRKLVKLACNVTDADGDGLTYNWSRVSGPLTELNATDVPSPSFTPLECGTYLFSVVVSDGYSSSAPAAVTVVVANRMPVADAGDDITGNKNELVTLHGTGTDADGDPLSYDWTQTGGPDANLTQTSKSFLSFLPQNVGNYTFRLVVNDGEQDSAPSSATVTIGAIRPEAVLTANASLVYLNNNVDFSAEKSNDPDGNIVRFLFDFGDGTDSGWTNMSIITHAYSQPGVFNATLKVRDEDGLISELSAPVKLTVRNRPPVVKGTVTPLEGNTSTLFRFSVPSGSTYDPDSAIESYLWDFGDGSSASTTAASHTYKKKGEYEIVFRVTDKFGETAEAYFSVMVLNRGPVLLTSAPAPASFMVAGNEQLFTVTVQDPDADALNYMWTVDGNPQSSNSGSLIFKPQKKGQHRINVTVSDGDLSISADWSVTVRGKPSPATEQAGPDMLIALGAALVIGACAGTVYLVHRREKRTEQAQQPGMLASPATQPSQPGAPLAGQPAVEIPTALPVNELLSHQEGAGPMEALPVEEDASAQGQNTQAPQDNWTPVQEPYSKQLWNR